MSEEEQHLHQHQHQHHHHHHQQQQQQETDVKSQNHGPLCTFAVTDTKPVFQAIYLCHTCSSSTQKNVCTNNNSSSRPLCICQNCAEICHEDLGHDIEYVGDGPSYCDCSSITTSTTTSTSSCSSSRHEQQRGEQPGVITTTFSCCLLKQESFKVARKLNIRDCNNNIICGNDLGINTSIELPKHKRSCKSNNNSSRSSNCDDDNDTTKNHHSFPFVFDVYDIPQICPCDGLIQQALELVKYTRDTHWVSCLQEQQQQKHEDIDYNNMENFNLCPLEQLAYSIFLHHVKAYNLEHIIESSNNSSQDFGAEWWVQVKEATEGDGEDVAKINEAIDLHYDKDEELASCFDIGSFPTLSTVTYLTDTAFGKDGCGNDLSAPPTLVFAHTHEMVNRGPLGRLVTDENEYKQSPQLIVSHPKEGKHLCFDGKLLHGASSHIALRKPMRKTNKSSDDLMKKDGLRVTFLVNIWLTRRPSRVITLPAVIRSTLKLCSMTKSIIIPRDNLLMYPRATHEYKIGNDKGNTELQGFDKIHLPFVSNNAIWINEDESRDKTDIDNNSSGLIVSIIPPGQVASDFDTVIVTYDENLEPELEYIEEEEYDEEYTNAEQSHGS